MRSIFEFWTYLLIFIVVSDDHVTLSLKEYGAYLDSVSYKQFSYIGIKQCSKRCYAEKDCQSINFSKSKFTCTLSYYNNQQKQLVLDSDYTYVDRYDMEKDFSADVNCTEQQVMLNIHDGRIYCFEKECSSRLYWESNSAAVTVTVSGTHVSCSLQRGSLDYGGASHPGSAWCAASMQDSYIQFEFHKALVIKAVVTQGRADTGFSQWITSFKVLLSDDSVQWTQIGHVYTGNSDRNTHVTNILSTPVTTKFMRIVTVSYNGHASARFDLIIGCTAI